ncbi:MAG TPA: hypothetical protein VMW54_14275 [Terriglobia bacterium]|nr:hypothetical protein [Terriglobia bacterium]
MDTPIQRLADLDNIQKWVHAKVPDSVQWSLYRAGVLPHPYKHLNSRKSIWVARKVWYYQRQFRVPAAARGQYAFLCFDGVGYDTRIWLNGTPISKIRHRPPHVSVDELESACLEWKG